MQQIYSFSLFCITNDGSEPRWGAALSTKLKELVYLTEDLPGDGNTATFPSSPLDLKAL